MKKLCVCLFIIALVLGCFCGCAEQVYEDVTPSPEYLDSIIVQRTNIDDNKNYTYFEKIITGEKQIKEFCKNFDELHFEIIDPVEFNSADYLVIFEGSKRRKLYISGNKIIYDGIAYKSVDNDLLNKVAMIYGSIEQTETLAESKIFK